MFILEQLDNWSVRMLPCHHLPNRLSGNAHAMLELPDARPPFSMDDDDLGLAAAVAVGGFGPGDEGKPDQGA